MSLRVVAICLLIFCVPVNAQEVSTGSIGEIEYSRAYPPNAQKQNGLLWSNVSEFSPQAGQTFEIKYAASKPATTSLSIFSADNDELIVLLDKVAVEPGVHRVVWDGKDGQGVLVPDEAYTPVVTLEYADGSLFVDDPRRYSGGEVVENLDYSVRDNTHISYELPDNSRVLIRIGVDDGPLVKSPLQWAPVSGGRSVFRWDGFDDSGIDYLAERSDLWHIVMAYQLPEFSIITTGNAESSYSAWRKSNGWPKKTTDLSDIKLHRNGLRLSRDYFQPRNLYPKLEITLKNSVEQSRVRLPIVHDVLELSIDVPVEDRWVLDTTFYETGVYLDYIFDSEEEQGYVPMTRPIDVSELATGRHIVTVQLFGFGGFIISDALEFEKR